MASASYYKSMYESYKSKAKEYGDDIGDLEKIQKNLDSKLDDEIKAVNKKLEALKDDLEKSVRHVSKFTSHSADVEDDEEKSVSSDTKLGSASENIESEIVRLQNLKISAQSNRDYYYRMYKNAEEEESSADVSA